jgi:mannosyltransferase
MDVVALVAVTARLVAGKWAGFAARLIIAIAPSAQRFAHDARPFALATCLLTAATLLKVLASRGSQRWLWAAYSLCLALSGLVLPATLAAIPGHSVLITRANLHQQNVSDRSCCFHRQFLFSA